MQENKVFTDQIYAAGVDGFLQWKQASIARQIDQVIQESLQNQKVHQVNFGKALQEVGKVYDFLAKPEHMLGSSFTKHGEIAEHIEVYIRNAKSLVSNGYKVASFDGVGRLAAEDYILDGFTYQSKFVNGTNNGLSHVIKHMEKYEGQPMKYMIPKDDHELIQDILDGVRPEGLSDRSVAAIEAKVRKIEALKGEPFNEVIKPSISNYDEVQSAKAASTVHKHEKEVIEEAQEKEAKIKREAEAKEKSIHETAGPSLKEGAKVAGTAAAVAASINLLTLIYRKHKEGKQFHDYSKDDWSELGLSSAKAGAVGGVTAGSIYALTNLTSLSAPFAGAVTSAALGLTTLVGDLADGKIAMDEFVVQGQVLCFDAGVAAIGTAIGQTLIPIPVLGTVIGTVTTNLVWGFTKGKLGEKETELRQKMDEYTNSLLEEVDEAYDKIMAKITDTYAHINQLMEAAFDLDANAAVFAAASIDLAEAVGVAKENILYNDEDLDDFFLK